MSKRSYHEYCGAAKALDRVGERWTLLIVRNLLLGPLRYSDLLRGLPGITTNLLAKRLREMEENGVVERIRFGNGEAGHAYRLTELGAELEPVLQALGRWGGRWMTGPEPEEHRDLEWLLVASRRRYRGGAHLSAELLVEGAPYHFVLAGERVTIRRGPLSRPDVRARISAQGLARLLLEGWSEEGAPEAAEVEGGMERLRSLVEAFEPPARPPRGDG